jgi:hypothetical protein
MLVLAIALALLLALAAAPAGAQEPASVTFETGQPLSLTWAQLVHGKSITVCNGGRATVARVQLIPADFAFARGGVAVPAAKVIAITPTHRAVRAGECAHERIAAVGETPPDASEYPGALVLVSAGGGSARLQLTVATSTTKAAAPAGVAEPTTLSLHNSWPGSRGGDATLLLKAPASGEAPLTLGSGCESSDLNEAECPLIGNLYQDDRIVRVRVSGPPRNNIEKGVQELPVVLNASNHPVGSYEGSVTLPGSSQAIKLKLSATDSWIWAALALLFGAALALGPQLWTGHFSPKSALNERKDEIASRYAGALPGYPKIKMSPTKLADYTSSVGDEIGRYASSVIMLDTNSTAYKAIEASLDLAAADAKVFNDPSGLKRALDQLQAEVTRATELLEQKEVEDVPDILKRASALLVAAELMVGEPTQRVKKAEELTPLLVSWIQLTGPVLLHAVWLRHLLNASGKKSAEAALESHPGATAAQAPKAPRQPAKATAKAAQQPATATRQPAKAAKQPVKATRAATKATQEALATMKREETWWSADDAETLASVGPELWNVRERLFAASDRGALEAARTSEERRFVLTRIEHLAAKLGVSSPAPTQAPTDFKVPRRRSKDKLTDIDYKIKEAGETLSASSVREEHVTIDAAQARPAQLPPRNRKRFAGDVLVLVSSFLVALVAGLSTFYFGKSFGTLDDYLTVIVVGTAAQAFLKVVIDRTEVLLHDFSLQAPAQSAKVTVPVPSASTSAAPGA